MEDHIIIILAAGKSTRFPGNKLQTFLSGKAILDYSIDTALKTTPNVYLVSNSRFTHPTLPTIRQLSHNGTGGAVLQALKHIQNLKIDFSNVTVFLADCPLITTKTINHLKGANRAAIMKAEGSYGKILLENNKIKGICEYSNPLYQNFDSSYVWSGVVNFNINLEKLIQLLENLPLHNNEIYLTDLFPILQLQTHIIPFSEGIGINTLADYQIAEKLVQQQLFEKAFKEGALFLDSSTIKLGHNCVFEKGATIHSFVTLSNAVIKSTGVVLPFCVVESSVVEGTIGPFAHIRENTYIKENAHIGSFVETKNMVLEKGAKAKHLAYLGDCKVGYNSNIGAGVVMCNYDKFTGAKSKTYIGDNCDIGANSSLVAPLEIGSNSQIGAGSVITKPVPDNTLSVSRTPQRNLRKIKKA